MEHKMRRKLYARINPPPLSCLATATLKVVGGQIQPADLWNEANISLGFI